MDKDSVLTAIPADCQYYEFLNDSSESKAKIRFAEYCARYTGSGVYPDMVPAAKIACV